MDGNLSSLEKILFFFFLQKNPKQTAKSEDNLFCTVWVCTQPCCSFKEAKLTSRQYQSHSVLYSGCVLTYTFNEPIDLLIVSAQHSAKKEQFCAPEPCVRTLCAIPLRFSSKQQRLPLFRHGVLLEKSPRDKCACAALRNYQKVYIKPKPLFSVQCGCLHTYTVIVKRYIHWLL